MRVAPDQHSAIIADIINSKRSDSWLSGPERQFAASDPQFFAQIGAISAINVYYFMSFLQNIRPQARVGLNSVYGQIPSDARSCAIIPTKR